MYYLTMGVPVRASGRVDEHAISSVNCTPAVLDCLTFDGSAVGDVEQSNADAHGARIATVKQVLRTTIHHLVRSDLVLSDIRTSILTTLQKIRTTQELIHRSDLAIARVWGLEAAQIEQLAAKSI